MKHSFLLTCLLLLASLGAAFSAETKPQPFEKDIAAFEASDRTNPPLKGAILFVGDSTFTLWKSIHDDLPAFTVVNRGFGGSQMSDLLNFTDRIVVPYKPRLIVIQEGGNDIHSGKTPERFLADVKAFIGKVRASLPDVPMVFFGITPNVARWDEVPTRKVTNKLVQDYLATQKNVRFIDCFEAFLGPDGKPRDELYIADRMHPSAAGYKLRAEIVRPFLVPPDRKVGPK